MGLLDPMKASMDWTGDGKIDSRDAAFELGIVMNAANEMRRTNPRERENRISKMTQIVENSDCEVFGNEEFVKACQWNNMNPNDFDQYDINEISRRLDADRREKEREEAWEEERKHILDDDPWNY